MPANQESSGWGSRCQEATKIKIREVWIDRSWVAGRQSLVVDVWWDDS
jgi:hypothetical protein